MPKNAPRYSQKDLSNGLTALFKEKYLLNLNITIQQCHQSQLNSEEPADTTSQ